MSRQQTRQKVAIIGGGIAGLTAGYLISRKHDVTLYERNDRLGGNAYSYLSPEGDFMDIAVAVFAKGGYPNFYALLSELGIMTRPCPNSYMSFHDLDSGEGIYLTPSLKAARMQKFQLLRTGHLKTFFQVYLGLRKTQKLLAAGKAEGKTINECLEEVPELKDDARTIFLCTLCLLSSMKVSDVLSAPASFFFNKLKVHHDILSPKALYSVRCVEGGTRKYVEALAVPFRQNIVLDSKIQAVKRNKPGIVLVMKDGEERCFDSVVFACNADQILPLLEMPTPLEKSVLEAWKYEEGRLAVHRDYSSFPPRGLIQAYTFLYRKKNEPFNISVNGAIWHQPYVSDECEYIASQHPNFPISDRLTVLDTVLRTPKFDFASCTTLGKLPSLNGIKNTYYCGSYFGYGLHEDAVTSAISVSSYFGVEFEGKKAMV